jgi:integrase
MASLRKRNGKYQVQVRKDGKNVSRTFINKADAIKWSKEQEVTIEQGSYISKKQSVTLSFLLSRWEQEVLKNLKSWKVDRYKVSMIAKELGHLTLDNINSGVLVKYRDNRLTLAANQTVKHELAIIRRAMKKGIEWGYVSSVPFVTSPSLKGQGRTRRLKEDELNFLLNSTDEYLSHVIIVLIETAMRRGELATITKADINLDLRLIKLNDTKNGDDRIVPLSNKALLSVKFLLQQAKSSHLLNYKKEWLTEKFITHCQSINLENYRLHDLRHEGVSRLFEKGLSMVEVSAISGHKDLSMLKRYTHINPSTLLSKLDRLSHAINEF